MIYRPGEIGANAECTKIVSYLHRIALKQAYLALVIAKKDLLEALHDASDSEDSDDESVE